MKENLKRSFTILHKQCTESFIAKLGGDRKYDATKHDQGVIGIMNLIKGFMFNLDGNMELTHVIW